MKNTFTKQWFYAALIRAIKTFAQTAIGMIAVGTAMSDVDWLRVISVSTVAAILSILTSVSGLPEVKSDGTLLVDTSGISDIYRLQVDDLYHLSEKKSIRFVVSTDSIVNSGETGTDEE